LPERIFAGNQSTFRRHFCRFRDRLGFQWIQDGLRHTAATYHHALTGDIIKTAALLGDHDIRTLDMHYRGLTSRAEAERFFALRPGDFTAIGKGHLCKWYARGEQVRTLDGLIDWLCELWKLHDVFGADPAVAALLPA
jgi:hypothetical protein